MRTSRIRIMAVAAWMGGLLLPAPASAQPGEGPHRERAAEAARRAAPVRSFRAISMASHMGLEFAEVSDAIQAQVGLPAGKGVVIVNVRPGSPGMKAGFQANDILLSIDSRPISGIGEAREALARSRGKESEAQILRAGKEQTLNLAANALDEPSPPFRDWGAFDKARVKAMMTSEYWIGVPVSPVDPTLRSHLASSLPPEAGLIVNDVAPGSPAEKAGLKKNDILVTMDGKPLTSPRALVEQVHASEGKPVPLEILRAGKSETVTITPEKHDVLADRPFGIEGDHLMFRGPDHVFRFEPWGGLDPTLPFLRDGRVFPGPTAWDLEPRSRFEAAQAREAEAATRRLEAAIKELTAKIEDIGKAVAQIRKADGEDKPKDE